jgi:hypothetical protein
MSTIVGTYAQGMSAWAPDGMYTNSWTYDGPKSYTLAVASLGWVGGLSDPLSGSVATNISSLTVQHPNNTVSVINFPSDPKYAQYNWNGDDVVSVTFVLSVVSGYGAMVGRLDFWG